MKFFVDKRCPPNTVYFLNTKYIWWQRSRWQRVVDWVRGEWWAR